MRALALLAVGSTAACFGAGPPPTESTDATVVYALTEPPPAADSNSNQTCSGNWTYVGGVAFTGSTGYALPTPYPGDDCQSSGSQQNPSTIAVTSFDLGGGDAGGAATSASVMVEGQARPRVGVSPSGALATAYSNPTMGNDIVVALGAQSMMFTAGQTGVDLRGMVVDDGTVWIAVVTPGTDGMIEDPASPDYPGGLATSASAPSSTLYEVPVTGSPTAPVAVDFAGEYMKQVLVGNPTALYFVVTGQNGDLADVMAYPRTGSTATSIGSIPANLGSDVVPIGLAASPTNVAFAAAVQPTNGTGCWIWVSDGVHPATSVLSSTAFECSDIALDADHVYFTIVQFDTDDQRLEGLGLGRVTFDGATVETMSLQLTGYEGARRVHIDDAGNLYAIDPKVIGKLAADSLAGRSDFAF